MTGYPMFDIIADTMTIEEQLRKAARDSGLSIKALATRSGVRYASAHAFVRGYGSLTLPLASKLATLLGLELRPFRRRKSKG